MFSVSVTLDVHPSAKDGFVAAVNPNAQSSVEREPGCLRIDVIVDDVDPNRFHLYEIHTDVEAYTAHARTEHYAAWRTAVSTCVVAGSQNVRRGTLAASYAS